MQQFLNIMQKLFYVFIVLTSIILCNCNINTSSESIIKLGTSPDYPPFEYKKNGEVIGFDIDLVKLIASRLGMQVEIHEFEFNSLISALQANKVDCVTSGMTPTKERSENVDFSDIYYKASVVGIGKNDVDVSDLKNKKIGAQLGSVMEIFAKNMQDKYEGTEISTMSNNLHLLQELKLGRIDILLLEEGQVKDILSSDPELHAHVFKNSGAGYAIAFKKGSPLKEVFNAELSKLEAEGEISRLKSVFLESVTTSSLGWFKTLKIISGGVLITLKYSLISVFIGFLIGCIIVIARQSVKPYFKYFAILYLSILRGTPLILQLFVMYFAIPSILHIDISIFTAGIIAFSLNSGAYMSESIRAGIESIDKGQFEAAKSLGMSKRVMMQYVILPQAIKNIFPALINESINMIKESSIISVIGEADIMRRANVIAAEQYSYVEPLLLAAVCYYILILLLTFVGKKIEKRMRSK